MRPRYPRRLRARRPARAGARFEGRQRLEQGRPPQAQQAAAPVEGGEWSGHVPRLGHFGETDLRHVSGGERTLKRSDDLRSRGISSDAARGPRETILRTERGRATPRIWIAERLRAAETRGGRLPPRRTTGAAVASFTSVKTTYSYLGKPPRPHFEGQARGTHRVPAAPRVPPHEILSPGEAAV